MNEFRRNFIKLIEIKDLSISEISRRTGIPRTTISDLKFGLREDIGLTKAIKIAHALDVTLGSMIDEYKNKDII